MEKDIERFIELVKEEASKHEDFVEDRVKETALYRLLEARYDNVNELLKMALKKSSWFEQLRDAMDFEWRKAVNQRVYNDSEDQKVERLLAYMEFGSAYKEVMDKCRWRYGIDELKGLAREIIQKYPSDGTLMGKFKDVGGFWKG